ncbi:Retrovirus-related Pol polyprotein from transposon RE2 [Sesamum angolense]|uniref:Retrovirus-related Pol polyprotein from transposon RE2 n=1 Tax=Sesamum angolense TaxID=2727404 RepID=A0AAE1WM44_9LAMI|nr:Retrovirus-related Pol polyprotein from transposon RE2 [Sesamum angolense]
MSSYSIALLLLCHTFLSGYLYCVSRICKHGRRLVPVMSVVVYTFSIQLPLSMLAPSASVSPLQWHSRLGHPSLPTLQKILPIDSARLECESCELGKHHRASFPPRVEKRSSSPFTLVHSDIWGPCRFESLRGFRYFITFVDDYSRMTWVYLLKDRSQVPTIITSFYNEIYTQFSVNIRILRTDNALEFVQKSVSDFCNSKGILHQTSCPYTSQQNGVAERKHRHLLDVARTKGYRCYDPQSRKSFTSADVTFFESTSFYSPQSPVVIPPPLVPLPAPTMSVPLHTKPPTRPLQVYSRRNRSTTTTLIVPPDLPPTAAPGNPSATPTDDLPIVLRKGKRSCTAHPLANSLSFQHLSPNYRAFSVSLSSVSILILIVRRYDTRRGRWPWTTKCLLSFQGGHGNLWRYLLMPILLLADGYLPSSFVPMGP